MTKPKVYKIIKYIKRGLIVFVVIKTMALIGGALNMRSTIIDKSGIEIPLFFVTIESKTFHTPGAFDSGYQWSYRLKVSKSEMESISTQIKNTKFYRIKSSYQYREVINSSLVQIT